MADEEDPIRSFLRSSLATGESYAPQQLAQNFYATRAKSDDPPDAWRRYLQAFKQQITSLAKAGEVEYLRKGKPIPLEDVKGVVRVRKASS
ncbi:MAG TPA: DUF3253 domain-containing protein [Magnetospirillaceae bacterium]|nr:DUF3253 domain-containing protein [Magnetospirillaceae bacterium]